VSSLLYMFTCVYLFRAFVSSSVRPPVRPSVRPSVVFLAISLAHSLSLCVAKPSCPFSFH
jgi:hypothetical protein